MQSIEAAPTRDSATPRLRDSTIPLSFDRYLSSHFTLFGKPGIPPASAAADSKHDPRWISKPRPHAQEDIDARYYHTEYLLFMKHQYLS